MQTYSDAGHRPHASFRDAEPDTRMTRGPHALEVTLRHWGPGPWEVLERVLYDQLQSNWAGEGDGPCYTSMEGMPALTPDQKAYVVQCIDGRTLNQVLEKVTFSFLVNNCSRATTHQLVRTRIGAAMMQHGGRDNDWRFRGWTIPETIWRASVSLEGKAEFDELTPGVGHCLDRPEVLTQYLQYTGNESLLMAISAHLHAGKELYCAMVDAGIPWQDARRVLSMGSQTYIELDYNFVALAGVLSKRLEHVMDWEINAVAQLMLREIYLKCPVVFRKAFKSQSDRLQRAAFAELDSWPPDGKYLVTPEVAARPRAHRPEQNPFWVLSPKSFRPGSTVRWVPTSGVYPHEAMASLMAEVALAGPTAEELLR